VLWTFLRLPQQDRSSTAKELNVPEPFRTSNIRLATEQVIFTLPLLSHIFLPRSLNVPAPVLRFFSLFLEDNLSGMFIGNGQFATMEVVDSESTIQFFVRGRSVSSDTVVLTYTSPVIIVTEEGYHINDVETSGGLKPWGGVLIAITVLFLLLILGLGYYIVRGRSFKADITRRPDYNNSGIQYI
jgi:hypothetical protein